MSDPADNQFIATNNENINKDDVGVPLHPSTHDIVADLPDQLAELVINQGSMPEDVQFEPGVYCIWEGHTFIHTRATLPLHAIDDGVGFGLWVEIEPAELQRYVEAVKNDELYGEFKTEGVLANAWPGFLDTIGLPVTVRTVRMSDKVYITEVHLDRMRDVLFESALLAQQADEQLRRSIQDLVTSWMGEVGLPQADQEPVSSMEETPPAEYAPADDEAVDDGEVSPGFSNEAPGVWEPTSAVADASPEQFDVEQQFGQFVEQPVVASETEDSFTIHDQPSDQDGAEGLSQPIEPQSEQRSGQENTPGQEPVEIFNRSAATGSTTQTNQE